MYHKVVLVGNVGRDPELRYTPSGQAVTNLSVATNRSYKNSSDETVEETIWFRVTCWGRMAETVNQYVKKGRQVLVEGRLIGDESGNPKIWNRQDGTPGASFEINAQTVRFLGGRPAGGNGEAPAEAVADEEIPF
jgi:single-strand DNA-binding protein